MSVLDNIVRKVVLKGPETVSADWTSPSVSIDGVEAAFSVELKYDGGAGVSMEAYIEYSSDNENFATDSESQIVLLDDTGVCLWDMPQSALLYIRVRIIVLGGSMDVQSIRFFGNRRH